MNNEVLLWIGFNAFVVMMLALDLGVFHRKEHEVKMKEALVWTGVWICLALLFNAGILIFMDKKLALEFLTGYLIEKSLSVDNIFVFVLIFGYFNVPHKYQHKILFWGILGALLMRIAFILAGIALIDKFEWIVYVFGSFLIFTGIKMFFADEMKIEPEKNPVVKLFKKLFPVTDQYHNGDFMTRINGRLLFTPLFIVLLVVEMTDVIFAVDSIPAILAISRDPFIVYTSNVFAILGLRSFYFAINGMHGMFHYLKYGLAFILLFVGVKMVIHDFYKIPVAVSLGIIASAIAIAVILSIYKRNKDEQIELR